MTKLKPLLLFFLFTTMFALAGCEKDGPAERAGEAIDNAVNGSGNVLEDAADDIGDEADDLADDVQDATN